MNVICTSVNLDGDNWVYNFKYVDKVTTDELKHISLTICSPKELPYKLGSTYSLTLAG